MFVDDWGKGIRPLPVQVDRYVLGGDPFVESQLSRGSSSSFAYSGSYLSEDPFPFYEKMRSEGPIVQVAIPDNQGTQIAWMVTRFEEAIRVLKDQEHFTVDPWSVNVQRFMERREKILKEAPGFFGRSMLSVDEPDHMRLRGLVAKVFTPKYINGLGPRIQEIADELLDQVENQGTTMDLVRDYAFPLPINVISEMLGVPLKDRSMIREWSKAIATGSLFLEDEERTARIKAFSNYIVQLVSEKRRAPANDLMSQLIEVEESQDRLSEEELLSMISLLIFAGHETTSNLIGTGTLMLLDHPEQLEKLRNDPNLIPAAVEELLRFNGPVLTPAMRFATENTQLGNQRIRKGELVIVALASANRDERHFTDSEELDIARKLNNHIAFGQGAHICLGAPLARLEEDIAFSTLLRRMPNLRLDAERESITWNRGFSLRGITALPVRF